ncbi:hypothetical protein [Flavobacterium sp. ABG]|uniref:hypothetical protein n=1 Tax=Flavobacterium sp. ABG TaxID=1423322 RepID=UPI00069AE940|nr:hypothetical protein [Flavobacterium sp. ABG]
MRKNAIHNFNISIEDSTVTGSSEQLTKDILKELAKVSKEMSQQKDIVQEWEEQKSREAAAILNNSNASTEGGATDTTVGTNQNSFTSISTTPSVSEEAKPDFTASTIRETTNNSISSTFSETMSNDAVTTVGRGTANSISSGTSSNTAKTTLGRDNKQTISSETSVHPTATAERATISPNLLSTTSSTTKTAQQTLTTPTGGGAVDTTGGTNKSSSTSTGNTSPGSGAASSIPNLSGGLATQTYASVAAQQIVAVPQKMQINTGEPTLEVIKAAIKRKLAVANETKDAVAITYWTSIVKAFEERDVAADFDGKPEHTLFTEMYALLKQSNQKVIETQNFNWDIVRKKMIKAIDSNILHGRISKGSKERWTTIKKQLGDDSINVANLFEQYDELFLLLKEVEGLDALPNTITITSKTKIYPNLSADKLYASIGREEVYVFLRKIEDIQGSGVNKGGVKIKNAEATSFIIGESLEFFVDETFINESLHEKEDINWIVYNSKNKKDKGIVFADKGTSFHYNFDKAGTYKIEAYGFRPGANNTKTIKGSAFVEVEIVAQEIVITPPVIIKDKFTRPSTEAQLFKVALKDTKVKTLNPLKLYYQVVYTNANKVSTISEEQEVDSTGTIKLVMADLGEFTIKVWSKDQYALSKNYSIKTIKNFVDTITKEGDEKNIYLLKPISQEAKFKVKTFKIPATLQEKQNVKWLVYDKNNKVYIPNGLTLQVENNQAKKQYLAKGESFAFPIPNVEGEFTIEAYSNSSTKEGGKSNSTCKIEVKYPQATEASWAYSNGSKKGTSGFAGESNWIKATIPNYNNQIVRIYFYLNTIKTNHYCDVKTNENGEIFKEIKFDSNFKKQIGFQNRKTANIGFKLEGIQQGKLYPFKKPAYKETDVALHVSVEKKIIDAYFRYDGNRVTAEDEISFNAKGTILTIVVKTQNMIGDEVVLTAHKVGEKAVFSNKAKVNAAGVAATSFSIKRPEGSKNGEKMSYYVGVEGYSTKHLTYKGVNMVAGTSSSMKNDSKGGSKNAIDIAYFLEKYKGENEANLKVLLTDMNEYFMLEKLVPLKEQVAYMLATVYTETFKTFKPVRESFWIKDKVSRERTYHRYDPILANTEKRRKTAIERGNTKEGDGVKYSGRGYVQLTWKNNYVKMKDQFGVDLVNYPDKAMEPKIAAKIMIWGMNNGIFTGVSISKYVNESKTDYVSARKVINGKDQARSIANDAEDFEQMIKINKSTKVGEVKRKHSNIVTFDRGLSQERINQISNKTITVLENAANDSLNKSVIITSTIRNPMQQAKAMYDNESFGNHIRYAEPGRKVVKLYNDSVKKGKSENETLKLMAEKITALYKLGELVSKHCVPEEVFKNNNIVDVSFSRGLINKLDFIQSLLRIDAVTKIIHPFPGLKAHKKLVHDSKEGAIHVEVKQ